MHICVEPTTDRFTAIMHTSEGQHANGRQIPGHALVMQSDKPFRGLASFGSNFLSKFEGAELAAPILRNITIVDTPGVSVKFKLLLYVCALILEQEYANKSVRFTYIHTCISHYVCRCWQERSSDWDATMTSAR